MPDISSQVQEILLPFVKKNGLFLALFTSGILMTGYGILHDSTKSNEIELVKAEASESSNSTPKILVDVSGAVVVPGMYELDEGARVQDALVLAGGFDEAADKEYISQYLNLAQKLSDGAKLYIPRTNQNSKGEVAGIASISSLININTASESELDTLPAIGMVTAGKIIDGRPYQDIGDLVSKKIVGQKTYDKIKDLISVY
jgi:competence protein ComEA